MNFFIFILISTTVFADCKFEDGSILKEGFSTSLMAPGKSLSSLKVQDQDGLLTCYANSASVALKSVLPKNPDVSYLDLALKDSVYGWDDNWAYGKSYTRKKDDTRLDVTAYGWTCDAITAARDSGGVCPQSLSILENQTDENPTLQHSMLLTLGAFFDYTNALRTDPAKVNDLKTRLSKAMPLLEKGIEKFRLQCEEDKKQKVPLRRGVTSILGNIVWDQMESAKDCNKPKLEAIKKYLDPSSEISENRSYIVPSSEILAMFEKEIKSNNELYEGLAAYAEPKERDFDKHDEFTKKLEPIVAKVLTQIYPEWYTACPLGEDEIFENQLNGDAQILASYVNLEKHQECRPVPESAALKAILKSAASEECLPLEALDVVVDALHPLLHIKRHLDDKLVEDLLNPLVKNGGQLMQLVLPACTDKGKLIDLSKVSCRTDMNCDFRALKNLQRFYDFPGSDKCYTAEYAQAKYRKSIFSGIKAGRALPVDVCTNFLHDPHGVTKTDFCQILPKGHKRLPGHSMTVTGFRCQRGKFQYQVLDSGGTSCTYKNVNPHFSCETKGELFTGAYWINEASLIDNSTGLSTIKQGP